jgi:hypothetical protein
MDTNFFEITSAKDTKNTNFFEITSVKDTFIKLFIIVVIIPITLKYIFVTLTKFETKITIQNKYKKYNTPDTDLDDLLIVVDNKNNEYNVTNLFFKFDFNKKDDWKRLKINKTYIVRGYGLEIKSLGLYKNIYERVNRH